MSKVIQFEGQTHVFPADFTDAEISAALDSYSPQSPLRPTPDAPPLPGQQLPAGLQGGPQPEQSTWQLLKQTARPQVDLLKRIGSAVMNTPPGYNGAPVQTGIPDYFGMGIAPGEEALSGAGFLQQVKGSPLVQGATDIVGALKQALTARQKTAVEDAANALAEQIGGPNGMDKLKAGQSTRVATQNTVNDVMQAKNDAYNKVAQLAANAPEQVQTGTQEVPDIVGKTTYGTKTVPVMQTMNAPVPLAPVKKELTPIWDEMNRLLDSSTQRENSLTYGTLKRLMNGPDYVPLTDADKILSEAKSVARNEADVSGIKNRAGYFADRIVDELKPAVDAKAEEIGALDHLNIGRSLNTEYHQTAAMLHDMTDKPVQLVNYLTASGDKGINQLQDVADTVPGELRNLGHAYLKGILEDASRRGKFNPAQAMTKWNELGDESKKLLFTQQQANQLDDLFEIVGKKINAPGNLAEGVGTAIGGGLGMAAGRMFGEPVAMGDIGARIGGMAGRSVANFVNGKLNIGGQMMLNADQTARVLMSPQGPGLIKTALQMSPTDPEALHLGRMLMIVSGQANANAKPGEAARSVGQGATEAARRWGALLGQ